MINKKVFALTLIASSVIAAGCSSDDDDDDNGNDNDVVFDQTTDAVSTDAQSVDVTGDGILTDADDYNNDGFIDNTDVELFAAIMADENSTDVNGDGSIDGNDDVDRDGDIDDDDITAFGGGTVTGPGTTEPTVATLPAGDDYDPSTLEPAPVSNLAELATAAGLTQLVQNVGGCDFAGSLSDPDARLTVFAPTDEAFGEQAVTDALGAGADVCDVIAGHVLVGTVANSTDLTNNVGNVAETLAGTTVEIAQGDDDTLTIGGATVVMPDNYATNGVAHIISSVILPMEEDDGTDEDTDSTDTDAPAADGTALAAIQGDGSLSSFAALVESSNFTNSLADPVNNNWIVFAPTNAAIDPSVTSAAAYIVTSQTNVTTAAPAPGTYRGTGDEAQTFVVAGDEDNLTVNGEAAQFVTSANGGAIVKFGS